LAALGHEVHVITHRRATAHPTLKLHPIVRSWGFWALARIANLARSIPLDIVNIQYQAAAYGMTLPIHYLPRFLGKVPSVVTFHDLRVPYLFPKAGSLRKQAVYGLARSSGNVIITNFEDHFRLEREGGVRRFAEIPIGSNIQPTEVYKGQRVPDYGQRFGLPPTGPVIGYFGFLSASKGGQHLLEVLAQLPQHHLLLIGGQTGTSDPTNQTYAAEMDALAKDLGVQNRVHHTGYLDPVDTTYALLACDLMVMPYSDGASLRRGSLMACLAHGLPTVTTHPMIVVPELQDQQNILFADAKDPAILAKAVQTLTADLALRARLSTGALQVAQLFTWDKIAAQTADFFEKIVPEPHAPRIRKRVHA
jgi:glycosyltransferase involved in cell wall biosynthesis